MTDSVIALQRSIATVVRVLKIMEPEVPTAHGTLKLNPADIQSLRFIAEHPACMSSTLAAYLGVVPTTATSVVDRLVKRGFVCRTRPEDNRRAVALSLTQEGAAAFERIDAEERATSGRMLDALAAEEREHFVEAMAKIAAALSTIR